MYDAHVPLIEPFAIQDIYVDGVAKIEMLGTCARVWMFTYCGNERVLVAKLIRPINTVPPETLRRWHATAAVGAGIHVHQ